MSCSIPYRFKKFEIRKPNFLPNFEPEDKDYFKYNFDLVSWADDGKRCWSIASLRWNKKEDAFDFESVGLRYLEDREDGLEDWLMAWCKMKEVEYGYDED